MKKYIYFMAIALASCAGPENEDKPSPEEVYAINESTLVVSHELQNKFSISAVLAQLKPMNKFFPLKGLIHALPSGKSMVSPAMGGQVVKIYCREGQIVKKGKLLATLQHHSYIKLQQEYLEAQHEYAFNRAEYKRQGELALENAASIKRMQESKAGFEILESRVKSIAERLKLIHLDPGEVKPSRIKSTVPVYAPVSGQVFDVKATIGQYIGDDGYICQIINPNNIYVELAVPYIDMKKLDQGSLVQFQLDSDTSRAFTGKVTGMGQYAKKQNNMVAVFVELPGQERLMPGLQVKARIKEDSSMAARVAGRALYTARGQSYFFVKKDSLFTRHVFDTAKLKEGWAELGPGLREEAWLVTSGMAKLDSLLQEFPARK